jgi:hypothetical protein
MMGNAREEIIEERERYLRYSGIGRSFKKGSRQRCCHIDGVVILKKMDCKRDI